MYSQRHHEAMAESLRRRPEFMVTLELAVPSWAMRWRDRSPDAQVARARSLGQVVAGHGDAILYPVKGRAARYEQGRKITDRSPSTAEAFNALAEGIALLSILAEGGATLFGWHWHDRCPAAGPCGDAGVPERCRDRPAA